MTPVPVFRIRHLHEPTEGQRRAGNYRKRVVRWRGLDIAIENEPGSIRSGVDRDGHAWQRRMLFPYGYAKRSEGVDGDEVDIYVGPDLDAPMVYVVHQRKAGDWKAYDEDKCMVGFDSEESARAAYLASYDDPRFLGPITAMPADEFVAKVRATAKEPAMIKAILFLKSQVAPYVRGGSIVRGYLNRRTARAHADAQQGELFSDNEAAAAPASDARAEMEPVLGRYARTVAARQAATGESPALVELAATAAIVAVAAEGIAAIEGVARTASEGSEQDPQVEAAEDREDLRQAAIKDPHSEETSRLIRKVAMHMLAGELPAAS